MYAPPTNAIGSSMTATLPVALHSYVNPRLAAVDADSEEGPVEALQAAILVSANRQ